MEKTQDKNSEYYSIHYSEIVKVIIKLLYYLKIGRMVSKLKVKQILQKISFSKLFKKAIENHCIVIKEKSQYTINGWPKVLVK